MGIAKKNPVSLGRRETGQRQKQKFFKRPLQHTISKNKIHQKYTAASILAMVGLKFREDRGFARLVKIGGHDGR